MLENYTDLNELWLKYTYTLNYNVITQCYKFSSVLQTTNININKQDLRMSLTASSVHLTMSHRKSSPGFNLGIDGYIQLIKLHWEVHTYQLISSLDLLFNILNRKPSNVVTVRGRCDQGRGEKLQRTFIKVNIGLCTFMTS